MSQLLDCGAVTLDGLVGEKIPKRRRVAALQIMRIDAANFDGGGDLRAAADIGGRRECAKSIKSTHDESSPQSPHRRLNWPAVERYPTPARPASSGRQRDRHSGPGRSPRPGPLFSCWRTPRSPNASARVNRNRVFPRSRVGLPEMPLVPRGRSVILKVRGFHGFSP